MKFDQLVAVEGGSGGRFISRRRKSAGRGARYFNFAEGNFRGNGMGKKTMKKVCDNRSPVIITRKTAQPVVMMSLGDYQALAETTYLLRSPENARRLFESITELEAGRGMERELLE